MPLLRTRTGVIRILVSVGEIDGAVKISISVCNLEVRSKRLFLFVLLACICI